MRLTVIGGGGFRTPLVCQAFADGAANIDEIRLYDPSRERLDVVEAVLAGLPGEARLPRISTWTDLDASLQGADFVFLAIRVGGLEQRSRDEQSALELGVVGQETAGAAGIAYGMRTLPVAMTIARRVAAICPAAYLINFTNPVGMITEAMTTVLGDRVIGVCDSPRALNRRIAGALGLEPELLRFEYAGLNHLGWVRAAYAGDRDRLPGLLTDDDALGRITEAQVLGTDLVRMLGAIPNEYLYFYYYPREAVELLGRRPPRGRVLLEQQGEFYREAGTAPLGAYRAWRRATARRNAGYMAELRPGDEKSASPDTRTAPSGPPPEPADRESGGKPHVGGYEGVARGVIEAIAADRATDMIVNVRNRGVIPQLDDEAVVEVSCAVDGQGARPLPVRTLSMHQLGLMVQVKAAERLAIEAATTGAYETAVAALALHPLMDSAHIARELLNRFVNNSPELAAVIRR